MRKIMRELGEWAWDVRNWKMSLGKKYNVFLISSLGLFGSCLFLLNLAPATFFGGVENNLQPMPSVSVDLVGKANLSYPIEIPEGTKGMDPSISVHYNSSGGFGNMGVGWNLSGLEWITRDSSYGIDYSENDQFTSTLGGSLVKGPGEDKNYYPRKESFLKFVPKNSPAHSSDTWFAFDKSGTKYIFTAYRSKSVPNGNAILVWALSEVRDIYGNGYTVSYSENAIVFNYADRMVKILFTPRSNPVLSYTVNTPFPSNSIVSSIEITSGSNLERKYTFTYGKDFFGNDRLDSIGKREKVNREDIVYTDVSYKYSTTSQPSYTSNGEFSNSNTYPIINIPLNDKTMCIQGAFKCYEAGAVCADPVSCSIKAQKVLECYAYTLTWFIPCVSGLKIPMAMTSVGDIQGDGKPEILELNGSESNGDLHLEATSFNGTSFSKSRVSPNLPGIHYKAFGSMGFGDVNGDGKVDFGYMDGSALKISFSNGSSFNAPIAYSNVTASSYGATNYLLETPDFKWRGSLIDMNGDGRADYVAVKNSSQLAVYLWNGSGFDAERVVDVGQVLRNQGNGVEAGQFMDMDGDGRPEYVFLVPLEFPGEPAIPARPGSPGSPATPAKEAVPEIKDDNGNIIQHAQPALPALPAIPEIPATEEVPEVPARPGGSGDNSIIVYYLPSNFSGVAKSKSFGVANVKNPRNRWFTDINADGLTDFVIQNEDNTIDVSFFDGVKYSNPPTKISIAPDYNLYSTDENAVKKFFTDVNADGYPDFVRYIGGSIRVSYGNGVDFKDGSTSGDNGFSIASKGFWNMIDLNGDGKPDFVSIKETDASNPLRDAILSQPFSIYQDVLSNNIHHKIDVYKNQMSNVVIAASVLGGPIGGMIAKQLTGLVPAPKLTPVALLGVLQILANNPQPVISQESKVEVYFQNPRTRENQITLVDGGFGREVKIEYTKGRGYVTETSVPANVQYPVIVHGQVGEVVKSIETKMGNLLENTDTYTYSNPRIWLGKSEDVAMLGFKTKTVTSSLTGISQKEEYDHSSNLFAGAVVGSVTKNGIGEIKQTSTASYKVLSPHGRPYAVLKSSSETVYQEGVALLTTTQDLSYSDSYDLYGNLQKKTTHSAGSTVTETSSYEYDTTNWILGRPVRVTKVIDGVKVEDTIYSYSGNSGVVVTSMAGTDAEASSSISLDSYGNQKSVTDALGNTTTYEYDNVVHNFPTKVTNPLGFVVTKTYDTTLGLELTATDANGGVMRKEYDKKGRIIKIIPPGSESYVERYVYTDYKYPPSPSVPLPGGEGGYFYSVAKSVVNADGTEAVASEYFDLLGRSIRKESPGVQGKFIVETTEYDAKGQVTRKSSPYLDTLESPVYTTYTYHPYDGYVTKVENPDKSYSIPTTTGFNEKVESYAADGTIISTTEVIKNAKGQVLERKVTSPPAPLHTSTGSVTGEGSSLSVKYQYDVAGRNTKILDPENGTTTTVYDNGGRKVSVTDPNSGTTSYTYDKVGNIKTQKDARNITTTFTYDRLNRPTLVTTTANDSVYPAVTGATSDGSTILLYDEGGKEKFALGRLTTVVDPGGKMELGYDIRGNRIYQKRQIDDLHVIFRRTYDIQNRLESTTYPDGTKVYQKYASTGHFSGITMDSSDGSSLGHTVGSYYGPVIETTSDDKKIFKIIRETGNGVKQEIEYDPIKRRPKGLITKLAGGHVESQIAYTYDNRNNITKIEDALVNARNQEFVYDEQNRLTQAKGRYGAEVYNYSKSGNLMKRGNFTLSYGNTSHKHAVTSVTSPNTGVFDYGYDPAGNMISRNGDTMSYNGQGKLKQIDTAGGDKIEYLYDSTGSRIRKKIKTSGVITYNFDGLYEITKTPGESPAHTLYFKGLYGDTFSQMTRNDASLVADSSVSFPRSFVGNLNWFNVSFKNDRSPTKDFGDDRFKKSSNFCQEIAGSCSQYYLNVAKFYWVKGLVKGYTVVSRVEFDIVAWMLLVVVLYGIFLLSNKKAVIEPQHPSLRVEMTTNRIYRIIDISTRSASSVRRNSMSGFFANQSPTWHAKRTLFATPLLIVSVLFTFTQCGVVKGDTKGEAPWMLLASGINENTASVDSNTGGHYYGLGNRPTGSGSGGAGSSLVPVTGMYFLHPDHLGSITMVTDGRGNVVTNSSGKSHISYKPYGEILRTDSSGPDISKFKYTGQEEDKESSLLYYKARYYDPVIGRFLQADSMVFPERVMGMNRYMYVEGNPVMFGDRSGNKLSPGEAWSLIGAIVGEQQGIGWQAGATIGAAIGRKQTIKQEKREKGVNGFVNRIKLNPPLTAWPGLGLLYKGYRSAFTKDIKKGLNSDEKMAVLGYMVNGEEGALAGYMLGSAVDRKKYSKRKAIVAENMKIIRISGQIILGLVNSGNPAGWGMLADAGIEIGKEIGNELYDNSFQGIQPKDFLIPFCAAAAAQHLDRNPVHDTTLDTTCAILSIQ